MHYDKIGLTPQGLEDFQIGNFKIIHGDYTTPYLCVHSQDQIIYGYAQRQVDGSYLITKRFIHGFGSLDSL